MLVALGACGVSAEQSAAQTRRDTSAYICWLERNLPVGSEYFYSGPVRNYSRLNTDESQLMRDAFQAEVYRRSPSSERVRDLICRSEGATSSAERQLLKIQESWAQSGWTVKPRVVMTGWTYDFVAGSAGQNRSDPGPAVRLVAPGEAPRPGRPPAPAVEEGAGQKAVAGVYAVQQQRDQARIDRERAEKAAYDKAMAATRQAEADYARRVAEFEAEKARYEKDRAEWQARRNACKAGDHKACSGQARPM